MSPYRVLLAISEYTRAEGMSKQTLDRQGNSCLEARTGYLLYRAIRKLSLSRQGLISRRDGRFARVNSTLRRLSFEDCLDLGGDRDPSGGERDEGRCSRFDYGPAWKSLAIITRAPWRRWFRGNAIMNQGRVKLVSLRRRKEIRPRSVSRGESGRKREKVREWERERRERDIASLFWIAAI